MAVYGSYVSLVREDVLPFVPRGGRLLDLGGGDGGTAAAIRARGIADHVGVIDRVPARPDAGLDFAYRGDVTDRDLIARIGREQGPFDTILCLDILEHLIDPWALVAQLHRLLTPGGQIVASIPNVRHYSASLPLLLRGRWTYEDAGILDRTHLRFFVRETAAQLMTGSGLTLIEQIGVRQQARRDAWLWKASLGLLEPLLALQYIVRVRRDD